MPEIPSKTDGRDARGFNARRRSRGTALALTAVGLAAIAVPVAPALASGEACESRLVTIVILANCESEDKTPSTVIAQQQQQAVGGGGGGGAASSSSSSSSGSSGSGGSSDRPAQPAGSPAGTTAQRAATPTLVRGSDERRAVRRLKGLLRGVGMQTGPLNGSYDRETRLAVRRFQRKHNIPTDPRATVGTTTWRLLIRLNRGD